MFACAMRWCCLFASSFSCSVFGGSICPYEHCKMKMNSKVKEKYFIVLEFGSLYTSLRPVLRKQPDTNLQQENECQKKKIYIFTQCCNANIG